MVVGREAVVSDTIGVVIVTYNSRQEIGDCLDTLACATEGYKLDIVAVDNGSADGTLDFLRQNHPELRAIVSRNLGYAHGSNLGVRELLESGREYAAILFLNPDANLPPGGMGRLMEVLNAAPDIAGVSPHSVEQTGAETARLKTLFGAPMERLAWHGRDVVVSDRLHGNCMLIRPEVFRRIGFFDEAYFLYWEELDFCQRALSAGYRLLLCHDVLSYHRPDQVERPHRIYYMWRNAFRFARKSFPFGRRLLFLARRAVSQARELAVFVHAGRSDLARAGLAGLAAGLRGETGPGASRHAMPPAVTRSES